MAAGRRVAAGEFAALAGWRGATWTDLAGDASPRRYMRLRLDSGARAVLMDAPPDRNGPVVAYVRMARHLSALGLSAPAILAEDAACGFLLIEDLGDAVLARVIADDPVREGPLYAGAVDVLIALHRHPPPAFVPTPDAAAMSAFTAPLFEWYIPAAVGDQAPGKRPEAAAGPLMAELAALWARHADPQPVLILRDYHAENLIELPERDGPARIGLLDFQDAQAGNRAYDVISLLQDARRDVTRSAATLARHRYLDASGISDAGFAAALAVNGAQRALRILGIFTALALRDGKPAYLRLMPRVWRHLQTCLDHPALRGLATIASPLIPEPSADRIDRIAAACGARHA